VALAALPVSTVYSASSRESAADSSPLVAADNVPQSEARAAVTTLSSGQELVALRTATAKHYHLGGNRYLAVISAQPVHCQDEKGRWQEILPQAPAPNEPASTSISIDTGGDTYISEQHPGSGGFGHLDYLRVTNTGLHWWYERMLRYFDLSSIPSSDGYDGDKTILNARLELYVRDFGEFTGDNVQIDLYALTADSDAAVG
jgi:hypothetical protein